MERRAVDLARFDVWARLIERDTRTSQNEKMILKLKAWAYCASEKSFFSLMVELGKVY